MGARLLARVPHEDGGPHDGLHLQLRDFGAHDGQPGAPAAQHGVDLLQVLHGQLALLHAHTHLGGQLHELLLEGGGVGAGHEGVQRVVQQADAHLAAAHDAEDLDEVLGLEGQQGVEACLSHGQVIGQDHAAEVVDAVWPQEHLLGAQQADPVTSHVFCARDIVLGLHHGLHEHALVAARPHHDFLEVGVLAQAHGGHLP
mmetsp:Transcript_34430/g.75910  ORF Transcript_34430/g.75910 Transcript_34430/m.75910 type:complete len:200 (+) Transcript_34430:267-866(+)